MSLLLVVNSPFLKSCMTEQWELSQHNSLSIVIEYIRAIGLLGGLLKYPPHIDPWDKRIFGGLLFPFIHGPNLKTNFSRE